MADRTLQQFTDDLKRGTEREMPRKLRRLMGQLAGMGEEYAKDHYSDNGLGIVTGRLLGSIHGRVIAVRSGSLAASLHAGNNAEVHYAAKHEFGIGVPARPYIKPAIDFLRREMPDELRKVVRFATLGGQAVI